MGDLGCMDERGFIKITGRPKDMIIRGGLNIYPREIEKLLQTHPAVAGAAVVGVPDERWGEQLAAAIRLNLAGERPSVGELRAFCRTRMSAHKTSAYSSFVEAMPITPTGKVQKFVLQDRLSAGVLPIESPMKCSPERRRSCWTSGSSVNQISFGLSIYIGDRNAIIRLQPGAGRLPRPAAEVRRR